MVYCAEEFLEKNNDSLDPHVEETLLASSIAMVASICTPEGAAGGKAAGGKKSSFASVGAAFTRSLKTLMETLHACEGSHFVRCVKP